MRLAVRAVDDLRAEGRVVFGQRVLALDLKIGLADAGDGMKEDRLLHRRDQRMADAAQHGMVGPDGQFVFVAPGQFLGVVLDEAIHVGGRGIESGCRIRVETPAPRTNIVRRNHGVGLGMIALLVHEKGRMENLQRGVRVERRADLGDAMSSCGR